MKVDARALMTALQMMRPLGDEVNARRTDKGWQLHVIRADGVAIMSVDLRMDVEAEGFGDTPDEFVIESDRWLKALRTTGEETEIEFLDGRVRLSGKGLRHTFRLIDVDQDNKRRFQLPNIREKLTAECMVESDRVRALLSSVDEKRVDEMKVVIRPEGLMVSAYDDMEDGVDLTVPPEELALVDGQARSRFPLEAWLETVKALPADAVLDIHLGDDFPVMVDFGDRTYDATWLCAPRIPQE